MRRMTQCVYDPNIDALKRSERPLIESADVAGIGQRPEAIAERAHRPMHLPKGEHRNGSALPRNRKRRERFWNEMAGDDRRIFAALGRRKTIGELAHQV